MQRAKLRFRGLTVVLCVARFADAVKLTLFWFLTGNDLILIQGAGNIGKIARTLAEIKLKPQTQEDEHHG